MVHYRRSVVEGGVFFFTLTLQNRNASLLVDYIHLLTEAVQTVKKEHPFHIKAYVILPEHLHMVWALPQNDSHYSLRWKKIKTLFSKSLARSGVPLSKTRHNEYTLWQRRFWEHTIKDEQDFENHVHYIHYNPIKHGLVKDLNDWPYSSFHHYVKSGRIDKNWGKVRVDCTNSFGFGE
ncbi:MAG: transposase [Tatlockia sp.]